jgi:hypothetical protein
MMGKKYNIDDVKKYIKENTNAKLLSVEYIDNKKLLKFECECGETFNRSFSKFKNSNQTTCLQCSKKRVSDAQKLSEESIEDLFVNTNSKYIKSIFESRKRIIYIKCGCCGEEYSQNLSEFKRSPYKVCTQCANKLKAEKRKHPINKVDKELKSFNVERLSDYVNIDADMKLKCECNNIFYSSLYKLRMAQNKVCPKCLCKIRSENYEYDIDNFLIRCPDNIKILSEYNGRLENITFQYKDCGHVEERKAKDIIRHSKTLSCKTCDISLGEKKIKKYCEDNNIKYTHQYRIDDCRNIRPLPFDFYLPEYNILIEFQGQGHFEKERLNRMGESVFGGFEGFLSSKKNDLIKKKYIRNNTQYKFVEIMYYEYHQINNILKYSTKI